MSVRTVAAALLALGLIAKPSSAAAQESAALGRLVAFTNEPIRRITQFDQRKYFFSDPESSDGVIYQFLGE